MITRQQSPAMVVEAKDGWIPSSMVLVRVPFAGELVWQISL